jgi:uncharacterized protein YyaL (SSP411 family)
MKRCSTSPQSAVFRRSRSPWTKNEAPLPARAKIAAAPRAAFVCVGERCSLPVTDPNRLGEAVATMRG